MIVDLKLMRQAIRAVSVRSSNQEVLEMLINRQDLLMEYGITTPKRLRHFLAQMSHESGNFRYMQELGGYNYFLKYNNRKDLGNGPMDGPKYRGRGIIQLTGRANYILYGDKLGIDLVNEPHRAKEPEIAIRVAGQYWKDKGLNALADKDNIRKITKRINGGYNGYADRLSKFEKLSMLEDK